MRFTLQNNFTGIFLLFFMIQRDHSFFYNSVYAASYNSSEEIKNIFKPSHNTNVALKESAVSKNFAEGGLVEDSFSQSKSFNAIKYSDKNLAKSQKNVSAHVNFLNKLNDSSFISNTTINKSSVETSSTKTLMSTKLIENGSNLFLGVPEVIHINGTSSIKPRKGVHYSKIVPRKGVDNENEAFHVSLENDSCFWLSEKECYSDKDNHNVNCSCCQEDNVLGKDIKQTPVNCKNCKTFIILSSEENVTCKNICCNANNNTFYSGSSTESSYDNNINFETLPRIENKHHNLSNSEISENGNHTLKIITKDNHNSINSGKTSNFKPLITKVPYDAESMTALLGKAQQKVFVPLAVSLFLLPLMGMIIFFLWQRTKEYFNKRYYKRMDFLIDGIYND